MSFCLPLKCIFSLRIFGHSSSVILFFLMELSLREWCSSLLSLSLSLALLIPFSVQFSCSVMSDSLQPHGLQHTSPPCPSPTPRVYSRQCLLIELMIPSSHLSLCHPLLLPPLIFPSIRVFSNESILPMRWSMYWSFTFSISPSNEYSGLISFRIDWCDLLVVQGTLKSVLQDFWTTVEKHQIFDAQLSLNANYHIHTRLLEKPWLSSRQTFVGKVMSLIYLDWI